MSTGSASPDFSSQRPMTGSGDVIGLDTLIPLPGRIVLPPVGAESAYSQRHEVNPAMALSLIGEIQSVVTLWRDQLREIVRSLQVIHAQGPMVDGWLESSAAHSDASETSSSEAEATILRHGDTDALMRYIDALEAEPNVPVLAMKGVVGQTPMTATATQYRLCCLDEEGQVRSQPCPPEQMGSVSVAIARYQNYKQLLSKKQVLEAKLKAAVDRLSNVRTMLQQEDLL